MIFQGYFQAYEFINLTLTPFFFHPLLVALANYGATTLLDNFPPWDQKGARRNQAVGNLSQ